MIKSFHNRCVDLVRRTGGRISFGQAQLAVREHDDAQMKRRAQIAALPLEQGRAAGTVLRFAEVTAGQGKPAADLSTRARQIQRARPSLDFGQCLLLADHERRARRVLLTRGGNGTGGDAA